MGLLHEALPVSTLVVAIDPGKVSNRVWLSSGQAGPVVPPLSLPVLRPGLDQLQRLIVDHPGSSAPVLAIEATGALHQARVRELNQRFPGSVRLFAPSETAAARAQPGSRRFKTDDRDCAALTYLARQGQGRLVPDQEQDALTAAMRHRRGLIAEHKVPGSAWSNCLMPDMTSILRLSGLYPRTKLPKPSRHAAGAVLESSVPDQSPKRSRITMAAE